MKPAKQDCIACKGRYCNNFADCPLYAKARAYVAIKQRVFDHFEGSSPAPFVGQYGYPKVNVGILTPPNIKEDAWIHDAPIYWSEQNLKIAQIIPLRASLVNSKFLSPVKGSSRHLEAVQEITMATRPVEVEVKLKESPRIGLSLDPQNAPQGAVAPLKDVRIAENPTVSTRVEKVVSDTDMKAADAIGYLSKKGYDENTITKLLSVGLLGSNRKLVPTRWSITSTDDTLGKQLIDQVKGFQRGGYQTYFGGYLGNYYLFLFFPEMWSFELFETYITGSSYATDFESYDGRKTYAIDTAGGYYTARLAALEKLSELKRQGTVIALRYITDEYTVPLGVWVTRQAARKALSNAPVEFSSKELMINYAVQKIKKAFGQDANYLLSRSILLISLKEQTKLSSFS
jgi:DNA repair protein NreA